MGKQTHVEFPDQHVRLHGSQPNKLNYYKRLCRGGGPHSRCHHGWNRLDESSRGPIWSTHCTPDSDSLNLSPLGITFDRCSLRTMWSRYFRPEICGASYCLLCYFCTLSWYRFIFLHLGPRAFSNMASMAPVTYALLHTIRKCCNQGKQSVANSIQKSSQRTYSTGVRHWFEFVKEFGTDPFMRIVPREVFQYKREADSFHHTSWQRAYSMGFLEWLQGPPKPTAPSSASNYLYAVMHNLVCHGLDM